MLLYSTLTMKTRRGQIFLSIATLQALLSVASGFSQSSIGVRTTSLRHTLSIEPHHNQWRRSKVSVGWKLHANTDDEETGNDETGLNDQDATKQKWNILDKFKAWLRSEEGIEDIKIYVSSVFLALMVRFLIIEPRYIPSLSMYPTFDVGDQLAVEKVTKRIRPSPYNRNEVVVFRPPEAFKQILGSDNKKSKEALIKRVVAIEGDKVEVTRGKLFINGKEVDEPFTAEDAEYEFGPVVVPAGNVLVLGDNRNHSLDGHIWGFLPKKNIIGRAVFIYWPPWRFGNNNLY